METRQKTEYKVFVLQLADMRGGVDKAIGVAVFDELEKLKLYYQSQLAPEYYKDKGYHSYTESNDYSYHKVFKKGSALEWFNPASSLEVQLYQQCAFGGVYEAWTDSLNFTIPFNPTN